MKYHPCGWYFIFVHSPTRYRRRGIKHSRIPSPVGSESAVSTNETSL